MPVAAATALLSAGIAATAGGSPTPPGAASLGTMTAFTGGARDRGQHPRHRDVHPERGAAIAFRWVIAPRQRLPDQGERCAVLLLDGVRDRQLRRVGRQFPVVPFLGYDVDPARNDAAIG